MQVFQDIFSVEIADMCVQTIGGFDGLHRGHQYLLEQVREAAAQRGAKSMVITFSNHPSAILHPDRPVKLLTTLDEKVSILEGLGIDYAVVIDFTPELSRMSAKAFMKEILIDKLKGSALLVGYDHRFGHQSSETFSDYQRYGKHLGMEVILAGELPQEESATHVCSSAIRKAIAEGDMALAADLLGRHYSIEGTVTHGEGIGRTIGFPTANIAIKNPCKLLPKKGAYMVRVIIDETPHTGMLYIGNRPTLDNLAREQRVEVYILDYNEDIYGQDVRIEFVDFLRGEQQFSSIEDLQEQLKVDLFQIRERSKRVRQ